MQLEVILPLVAYLVVVFGLSVYAMRKRQTGTFLNEYFLGSRSMGGDRPGDDPDRDIHQRQLIYWWTWCGL
ncbi:sodium/panthothenate symporter [Citrobacter amalonaticus]|nr:sodium/panthothenate symporter [Citrobacter amalonaticus]